MFFCRHQWEQKIYTLEQLGFPNLLGAISCKDGVKYRISFSNTFRLGYISYPRKETLVSYTKCKKCGKFEIMITDGLYYFTFEKNYMILKILKHTEDKNV